MKNISFVDFGLIFDFTSVRIMKAVVEKSITINVNFEYKKSKNEWKNTKYQNN